MGADEAGALVVDTGEKRLNELGYKQTLKRELDYIMSFCTLISTMALPIALTSLYGLGYTYGGPVTIIWGWVVVSFFTMFVAVSLAEILSSLPTSGGIYYHAYYLGGKKWGKVAAWYTGWFNWLGYVAGYGSSGYFFSNFIAAMINLSGSSYSPSRKVLYGIACANFGCGVLLNLMPVRAVGRLSEISTVWNAALTLFFVVGLPAIAPTHQSASFVFTEFFDNSEALGLDTPFYLFCVGLLMSQFALGGFDLNGHLSEETKKSDSAAAWSTVMSTFTNALMGLAILLGLTFSIQDPDNVQNPDNETGGYYAGAQIIFDIFKARFGSGTGAVVFIGALVLCFPLSLATGACATARVVWAMSRDGATPFSFLWMKLHPKTKVPIMAVILTFAGMVIVLLPVIWSPVAFTAISSFTVMGVFLGCGVPILMKVTVSRNSFKPGPFSLGPFFGPLVNYVALAWIVTVTVVFSLPTVYPITTETFNYAPVALVALFVALTVPWLLPRTVFDFQGPRSNMTDFDMKAGTTEEQIKDLFSKHGGVMRIMLPAPKPGQPKRDFGFVHFAERSQALKAIDQSEKYELNGKALEVSLAKPPVEKRPPQEQYPPTFRAAPALNPYPQRGGGPSAGYGYPAGGSYGTGYGQSRVLYERAPAAPAPVIYGRGPAPAGMTMVPMVLPDGRVGYVFQPGGGGAGAPPPYRDGARASRVVGPAPHHSSPSTRRYRPY